MINLTIKSDEKLPKLVYETIDELVETYFLSSGRVLLRAEESVPKEVLEQFEISKKIGFQDLKNLSA